MKFSVYEIVKREKIFGLWKFTTENTTLKKLIYILNEWTFLPSIHSKRLLIL